MGRRHIGRRRGPRARDGEGGVVVGRCGVRAANLGVPARARVEGGSRVEVHRKRVVAPRAQEHAERIDCGKRLIVVSEPVHAACVCNAASPRGVDVACGDRMMGGMHERRGAGEAALLREYRTRCESGARHSPGWGLAT